MGRAVKRDDLQRLGEAVFRDAAFLFEHARYSNSYYLAGYAIEFGLKACIAKLVVAEAIPDRDLVKSVYSHDFRTLVGLAGLAGPEDRPGCGQHLWRVLGYRERVATGHAL